MTPQEPNRVVITGIGPITASGIGVEEFWAGLHRAESPIGPLTRFDSAPFKAKLAAEINDFEAADFMEARRARRLNRFEQFSIAASRLALTDAQLHPEDTKSESVAVQMGSALGGLAHAEAQLAAYLEGGLRAVDPRLALGVFGGAASCNVAIEFQFSGPNATNAMSCASGTIAVGEAWRLIREGTVELALAGGTEAPLAPLTFGSFSIIRAMSTRNHDPGSACRPFDEGRDGFVMGEGACVLVLESERRARARGVRIYAELVGYGTTNDAFHMTAPRPDGSEAARAMRLAMERGGVEPSEVDYVNAHGSSTPLNDATETLALRSVLGERADEILVSGTKPYYGHALGASGAIEVGISALCLARGWVPPTLNLEIPGEGCDLNYNPGVGKDVKIKTVLTNSFGFGGINACLALRAHLG